MLMNVQCIFYSSSRSEKFSERTDRNTVVFQFGLAKSTKWENKLFSSKPNLNVEYVTEKTPLLECYKYMYQLPYDITIGVCF